MIPSQSTNTAGIPGHTVLAGDTTRSQIDQVAKVTWRSNTVQTSTSWEADTGMTDTAITITLNGTLAVVVAATALFTTFVLSGITFSLVHPGGIGTTSYNFTYTGTQSAAYIQGLLVAGANITLL